MNNYISLKNPDTGEEYRIPAELLSDGSLEIGGRPERKLATVDLVNLNTATATPLYTVPVNKSCIITKIIQRKASISLTTVAYSIGWTGAAYNDVLASATHTELTGPTLASVLTPKIGQLVGVSLAALYLKCNTLQGAAATASFDIYGILF